MEVDRRIANLDELAALPRKNGELVFQAPWEGRAFGIAVLLNEKGAYDWNAFRDRLVAEIGAGPSPLPIGERSTSQTSSRLARRAGERGVEQQQRYYVSWLNALESLLVAQGVVTPDQIERRAGEYRTLERDPVF
jgi:nitrile hydratase beta subunit-like protein